MQPSDNSNKDEFGQVVDKLKDANNVLVTISTNPTVDQFAACIGLTLVLNKIGKHANAVFSGKAPSTLDFLKPEKTLEQNTDSLRDFIIALDKSKADKLRYKVEDDVVKIFITPYKTSISEKDLEFSQGDFNVDVVFALGVKDKDHIDSAILAHGRILHDAAVIALNTSEKSRLGSINWTDARASSLCEMVADVASELDNKVFDSQIATALLTGIVAETDRYSNDKAAPHTMSVAGLLMAAGASTQLVSSKLEAGPKLGSHAPVAEQEGTQTTDNGVLEIEHPVPAEEGNTDDKANLDLLSESEKTQNSSKPPLNPYSVSSDPNDASVEEDLPYAQPESPVPKPPTKNRVIHEPPEMGGQLTANTIPEEARYTGSTDPLSNMPDIPVLNREDSRVDNVDSLLPLSDDSVTSKAKNLPPIDDKQTLTDIEKTVASPHLNKSSDSSTTSMTDNSAPTSDPDPSLDEARDAVLRAQAALNGEDTRPEPRQDVGSTELGSDLGANTDTEQVTNDSPPPPVPPPLMPQS
ncbi:MAG TPA: hypothetical protein VD947_03790 [Patescibacteria group bacterium]|nr:hypothetical protein [Patescibacteria group bacterium]